MKIREKIVEEKMLRGVISMPSNIFATTGTNVSVLFLDKNNTKGNIVLMDASSLGTTIKDGKNKKTFLSSEEESLIVDTFKNHSSIEDLAVVVDYNQIKNKDYSLSAGQYFDVKVEYSNLTPKEFQEKMDIYKRDLENLFTESKSLESEIKSQLDLLKYEK
jgi:type I restriction enzyme M protein